MNKEILRRPFLPEQVKQRIFYFARRFAMDVDHLGEALVDQLVTRGIVKDVADLYNLANRRSEAVLEHCEVEGIGFIPWSPIAEGTLSNRHGVLAEVALRPQELDGARHLVRGEHVERVADRHGETDPRMRHLLGWRRRTAPCPEGTQSRGAGKR